MDKLNKKGIVFTFIVVVLLSVVIIAFLINVNNKSSQSRIQTMNVKTDTLNSFVKNLNSSYLPNSLRVSSNQAMLSLIDYESNNTYVNNINDYFAQVLSTGYYNGVKQSNMFQNSLNYTLPNTLNEIKILALQQGVLFDYSNVNFNSINLTQDNPWKINIKIKMSYSIKDEGNELFWNINNKEILSGLNVYGYRDPIYLVEQKPGVSLAITRVNYNLTYFSSLNNFNVHIQRGNFTNNPSAPSFIQRLQGDFKKQGFIPSLNGIESLLDPAAYSNPQGYSNADYQFYARIQGLCVRDVSNNFKLDQNHINYYGRSNC